MCVKDADAVGSSSGLGLPGDICLYLWGSGCRRLPCCKKKEVNNTQACKLPATCQYKQNLPYFYSASSPHPQCLFPIWHPLFPSLQPQQLCFLQWFSSSHLCCTIGPKVPGAQQKGWSSQERSSWNCGHMKHRIHCSANRGEKTCIHWPISIYCLGAIAENS